ncbi:MAG: hypothetical protein ACFCUG_09470 [Thiotrichales bacterium]
MNRHPITTTAANEAEQWLRLGTSALETAFKSASEIWAAGIALNPVLRAITAAPQRSSCEIPPPCWLPRDLGELRSVVCVGGVASLRLRVTNCQARASQVSIKLAANDLRVEIEPDAVVLGPQERRWFTLRLFAPQDACVGNSVEAVIWVQGCNSYFLRWILDLRQSDGAGCHEVEIDDCPDHVHHWYDHFYCVRPCVNQRQSSTATHA